MNGNGERETSPYGELRGFVSENIDDDLRGIEYFVHGTTQEAAETFVLDPGRRLFTAVDADTAAIFARRTAGKMGGDPGGVVLTLPRKVAETLRKEGMLRVKEIDDMPHLLEWIFEPGAADTIDKFGSFVALPRGFFK